MNNWNKQFFEKLYWHSVKRYNSAKTVARAQYWLELHCIASARLGRLSHPCITMGFNYTPKKDRGAMFWLV